MDDNAKYKKLFVSCTQEQYDSLEDPDDDTLYFTSESPQQETYNNQENP